MRSPSPLNTRVIKASDEETPKRHFSLPRSLATYAARLLFPARCAACGAYADDESFACERCRHAVFRISAPICKICGEPRQPQIGAGYRGVDATCGRCALNPPRYISARARWEYTGSVADAIQRAKYGRELWILRALAHEIGPWLLAQLLSFESNSASNLSPAALLTTVPMHPLDLKKRGFDLPYLLLRLSLKAARAQREISTLAEKTKRTPAQAGLGYAERRLNLRGAFSCLPGANIAGRDVLVFDDVLTTGATADEVAKTLRRAGAERVFILSAARAVNH